MNDLIFDVITLIMEGSLIAWVSCAFVLFSVVYSLSKIFEKFITWETERNVRKLKENQKTERENERDRRITALLNEINGSLKNIARRLK